MNILVVVAHPDDEVLGCGGAIARHVANGDMVSCLVMTNGVDSRELAPDSEERKNAFENSCKVLGIVNKLQLNFPDNEMDTVSMLSVVKEVEKFAEKINPQIVYTHHKNDLNIDHRIVFDAVMTCFRPQPGCAVKEIRSFEVASSTQWRGEELFRPNLFINITDVIDKKTQALDCYEVEMRSYPHQRSKQGVVNVSQFRGNMVGLEMAEAFEVVRRIEL